MFCKQCGAEIHNEALFCPSCGCRTGDEAVRPSKAPEPVKKEKKPKKPVNKKAIIAVVVVLSLLIGSGIGLGVYSAGQRREAETAIAEIVQQNSQVRLISIDDSSAREGQTVYRLTILNVYSKDNIEVSHNFLIYDVHGNPLYDEFLDSSDYPDTYRLTTDLFGNIKLKESRYNNYTVVTDSYYHITELYDKDLDMTLADTEHISDWLNYQFKMSQEY